nr:hypothetical protein CFP56_79261 [Quercus suber]
MTRQNSETKGRFSTGAPRVRTQHDTSELVRLNTCPRQKNVQVQAGDTNAVRAGADTPILRKCTVLYLEKCASMEVEERNPTTKLGVTHRDSDLVHSATVSVATRTTSNALVAWGVDHVLGQLYSAMRGLPGPWPSL